MLRLYSILGDNRIFLAVLARAIGAGRSALNHWLREESRVNSMMRLKIETTLKRAGISWKRSLWDSEPDFVHPFFEAEARSLGRTQYANGNGGVEVLDASFVGARHASPAKTEGRATHASPLQLEKEAPMAQKIPENVLAKFRLERDPFTNELHDSSDVFMSRAHKRAEWELLDAAAHQHFVAMVGPVGAGKTVILKKVLAKIDPARDPSFALSRLQCVEKEEANAYSIMEALIRDFTSDGPKHSREARARQIGAILESMVKGGKKPVLVIDEAHALNYRVLRALKRLYDETEYGFRRSIAILLVGQNTNRDKSYNLESKLGNWDLREVSERCQLLKLGGLKGELGDYLVWKFARAGSKREIVLPDAVRLLGKVYDTPLAVNNVVSVAMTLAADVGKDVVNAELMSEAITAAQSSSAE